MPANGTPNRGRTWLAWVAVLWLPALVGWLLYVDLVPGGTLELSDTFRQRSRYLGRPLPADRVLGPVDDPWWGRHLQVTAEPIYFDLRLPRSFTNLTWELTFHPGEADLIELGVAHPARPQDVLLQPFYHRQLETLAVSAGWTTRQEGDLLLLQRGTTTYPTLVSLLRTPPALRRIARYRLPAGVLAGAAELPADGVPSGVDVIVARYRLHGTELARSAATPWRTGRVDFRLPPPLAAARQIRLVVSVPQRGLSPQPLRLAATRVTLAGERLTAAVLREWLTRWFRPSR